MAAPITKPGKKLQLLQFLYAVQHGRTVRPVRQSVAKGMNHIDLDNLGSLSNGTYILQVITDSGAKSKRVVKVNK